MADIFCDFPIKTSRDRVFRAVSTGAGLATWWTKRSQGRPAPEASFELWFGPDFDWRATVSACEPGTRFELVITQADPDWRGTKVGFQLETRGELTQVRFHHTGWSTANEHWRVSCYCWPAYLRLLRRYLEHGEVVPYERRLDV